MKFGTIQRIVDKDGIGRLWLVDDSDGESFNVSGKVLREAGVSHPAVGDAFEFIASCEGRAIQLRRLVA